MAAIEGTGSDDPDVAGSYVVVVPKSDAPLVISPDLDALLAHDQRTREPETRSLGQPKASGLPPPPRPKKSAVSRRPTSPVITRIRDAERVPPVPNPYINRPPALEIRYQARVSQDELPATVAQEISPDSPSTQSTASLEDVRRSSGESSRSNRIPHPSLSLPRVDKVLGMAKGAFMKLADNNGLKRVDGGLVSDASSTDLSNTPPAVSHVPSSSQDATESIGSSTSRRRPPEHRISISSTMYASDSRSSLESHFYRTGRPSAEGSQPPTPYSQDGELRFHHSPDRESFIDLASPSSPPPSAFHFYSSSHSRNTTQSPASPDRRSGMPSSPGPEVSQARGSAAWLMRPSLTAARRSASVDPPLSRVKAGSRQASPARGNKRELLPTLPPTTNILNSHERAELIKKTRKITKMFGQTPDVVSSQYPDSPSNRLLLPVASGINKGHTRGAASIASSAEASTSQKSAHASQRPQYTSVTGRRHSAPLSPDHFSFLSDMDPEQSPKSPPSISEARRAGVDTGSDGEVTSRRAPGPDRKSVAQISPTSFMDFTEGDQTDDTSTIAAASPSPGPGRLSQFSVVTPSILEHMTPEERTEEERKRKRERLAKLHRFLGSRVPPGLVLDLPDTEPTLPPPAAVLERSVWEAGEVKARRRRSSSAAVFPTRWSDEVDRVKQELDEHEKAINVRRALKMERVFGVAPPQTLYHTRQASVALPLPSPPIKGAVSQPVSPVLGGRNRPPGLAIKLKSKKKKAERPGTSDSNKQLLPSRGGEEEDSPDGASHLAGDVYGNYRASLNSLSDIIDRDDRQSLAELHEYLHSDAIESFVQLAAQKYGQATANSNSDEISETSSVLSQRRRSLPMSSSSDVATIAESPVPGSSFQVRRRRAAKLTHFFGVDYCELVGEILDSIEKGVEEERGRGSLRPEEAQVGSPFYVFRILLSIAFLTGLAFTAQEVENEGNALTACNLCGSLEARPLD
ncbi:hypothetical protein PUNSTDRAFT_130019 [Punctularia strigosozonata HHB-11173 SS5]|uniref:uncharacterized protein n=1 Tax=Punctularia strigosozonata (strain HHB-11173) TaxID=741275 RepID=UPI000441679A|nr:uncharacterized protein PUNSTDRAFT_130019 [Punctularia strigosozonata HHB-11173 SS5]EIN14386.1 hypothetical protein PUNSTDRAFT_130019 [Punctularia strigosozonata HHB-11173 SS5]